MAGISHQSGLPWLDMRQIDISKIGHQQWGVMNACFNRAQHIWITGQGQARQHNRFAIHRVFIGADRRKAGNLVAHCQIMNPLAYCRHHTGHLMTHAGRQPSVRWRQILPPEHVIPADANRFYAHLHLTGCRLRSRMLLKLEDLGWTKLMKTDRAGHFEPRLMNL